MNFFLSIVFACFLTLHAKAQNSYIQVNGESGLSVYLNGQFKGKTTAEYNGIVLEDVKPGSNLIRVVKEGYVPFEERIDVKKGEVLSYKVKPFSKNTVTISEKGNTEVTDKKAELITGRLQVQSVPIEIKIGIERVNDGSLIAKTKDQWTADHLAAGTYEVKFVFGSKTFTKEIVIEGDQTTKVFVNMMNGNITVTHSADDIKAVRVFSDSVAKQYYFTGGIDRDQFLQQHPGISKMRLKTAEGTMLGIRYTTYYIDFDYYQKQNKSENIFMKGFYGYMTDTRNGIISATWVLEGNNTPLSAIRSRFAQIREKVAASVPAAYWKELNDKSPDDNQERIIISVPGKNGDISYYITYKFGKSESFPSITLSYSTTPEMAAY